MPTSSSICDQIGTHAHVLPGDCESHEIPSAWMTLSYQLESASCHDFPVDRALPAMTISQSRIVLATTGTRPMEKIIASAAGRRISCGIL